MQLGHHAFRQLFDLVVHGDLGCLQVFLAFLAIEFGVDIFSKLQQLPDPCPFGQYGNIALIITLILTAVFFTILLVSGNTMSQSVRERIPELAVLKTLGFQDTSVLGIVLAESTFVMCLGGGLGLALAWLIVNVLGAIPLPGFYLDAAALTQGVIYILVAGLAAGIFPAVQAMRLTIVDALSRA